MSNSKRLERRWRDFWQPRGVDEATSKSVWTMVHNHYTEPARSYHTLEHIEYCLSAFHYTARLADDPTAVEAAIWFHDVIYDTTRTDNEEASARRAIICLETMGFSAGFQQKVARLIRVTTHTTTPQEQDEKLIADVDLSPLGKSWKEFQADNRAIRKEYDWVPQKEYVEKRVELLSKLLKRGIYYLPHFEKKYGRRAYSNLSRAIGDLKRSVQNA